MEELGLELQLVRDTDTAGGGLTLCNAGPEILFSKYFQNKIKSTDTEHTNMKDQLY